MWQKSPFSVATSFESVFGPRLSGGHYTAAIPWEGMLLAVSTHGEHGWLVYMTQLGGQWLEVPLSAMPLGRGPWHTAQLSLADDRLLVQSSAKPPMRALVFELGVAWPNSLMEVTIKQGKPALWRTKLGLGVIQAEGLVALPYLEFGSCFSLPSSAGPRRGSRYIYLWDPVKQRGVPGEPGGPYPQPAYERDPESFGLDWPRFP